MSEENRSLRSVYNDAEKKRNKIEVTSSNDAQDLLTAAIQLYEECLEIASQISLFSPNESLEDITTSDLQYLLLNFRIAELVVRINDRESRKANLQRAQDHYERYLKRLDNYDLLTRDDFKLLEQYREAPNTFSTASATDAAARRDTKIKRFKEEKALKEKLAYMRQNPRILEEDDEKARELELTNIAYATHQSFASLESIAMELHILSLAPSTPLPDIRSMTLDDGRDRTRERNGYTDRLDGPQHLSAGMKGPLLDSKGKPLRPFTLLPRQELKQGVFRPDHSLPTMSIDEYLEEERKRGGMIEDGSGGAASGEKKYVDEDDYEEADKATMKARDWDEYVEANPKGSGNTINRG